MRIASFIVSIVQNTLAVYIFDLENPFNSWSKRATAQGFSWRPESVSFLLPEDGEVPVEVHIEREVLLRPDAVRCILVPFNVPPDGRVEISGIYEKANRFVEVPEGTYSLVFQVGSREANHDADNKPEGTALNWCVLTFVPSESTQPAILRRDSELNPSEPLVLDGKPA
jgi:competence protein J (ComJ)